MLCLMFKIHRSKVYSLPIHLLLLLQNSVSILRIVRRLINTVNACIICPYAIYLYTHLCEPGKYFMRVVLQYVDNSLMMRIFLFNCINYLYSFTRVKHMGNQCNSIGTVIK